MSTGEPPVPAAQALPKNVSPVSDIDSMKVPELKKRLKSQGLPTTGNKAELIERLQEAYLGEKDGSLDGGLDDESLEEALLNDDPDQSVLPETILGNEEFSFSSPEKETQKSVQNATKPLKKRTIVQASVVTVESPKASKPIVLKRNNYPVLETSTPVAKRDHPLIEPPKSESSTNTAKVATEADRLQMRAKRFNMEESKAKPAVAKTAASTTTTAPAKVAVAPVQSTATVKGGNLDVLRKRAQRFGENVSTVMKQLENQEKLLKRKLKFCDSGIKDSNSTNKSSSTEQDKKKKRVERFGVVH